MEEPPTQQDITKAISGLLTILADKKKSVLTIAVEYTDPTYAKKMVEYYLRELSDTLREGTLKDATENQKFLSGLIEKTSDVLLKEKIYALLAKEIEKETFARAQNPYSFQVLDPPIVPDLDKKVKPKRSMICMLSVIVAFFMAIFLAFFIEYVNNVRDNEDQERIERFKDSLDLSAIRGLLGKFKSWAHTRTTTSPAQQIKPIQPIEPIELMLLQPICY